MVISVAILAMFASSWLLACVNFGRELGVALQPQAPNVAASDSLGSAGSRRLLAAKKPAPKPTKKVPTAKVSLVGGSATKVTVVKKTPVISVAKGATAGTTVRRQIPHFY